MTFTMYALDNDVTRAIITALQLLRGFAARRSLVRKRPTELDGALYVPVLKRQNAGIDLLRPESAEALPLAPAIDSVLLVMSGYEHPQAVHLNGTAGAALDFVSIRCGTHRNYGIPCGPPALITVKTSV